MTRSITIVAPWFLRLAQMNAESLIKLGYKVVIVTSTKSAPLRDHGAQVIVVSRDLKVAELKNLWRAWTAIRKSDLVLGEVTTDPVFVVLYKLAGRRRVLQIHDAQPHDEAHIPRGLRGLTYRLVTRKEPRVICFSSNVRRILEDRGCFAIEVPLISELPEGEVQSGAGSTAERRNFAFVGRLFPYKNYPLVEEVAQLVLADSEEQLHVFGDGPTPVKESKKVRHIARRFDWDDVPSMFANYRAILIPYAEASQSGVQLLAMQLGVVPVISDLPGLLENACGVEPVVRLSSSSRQDLEDAIRLLMQPGIAEAKGLAVRSAYKENHSPRALQLAWRAAVDAFAPY